ncbi:MAG TPA: ester cyclase, partial [Bacteroidota bacterium]
VWIAEAARRGVASGVPATEKGFRARGMSILRAGDDGRITEEWSVFDEAQVLEQRDPRTPAPSSGDAEKD